MYTRLNVAVTIAMLAAIGIAPARASAETPQVIQRLTDGSTGTIVQVVRRAPKDLTITATGRTVTIERRMREGRASTTLRSRGHEVSITPMAGKTILRIDRRTIVVASHDERAAAQARDVVAASPLVADAIDLLGRLSLPTGQPATSMLQLTRANLIGATGDVAGAFQVMDTMRQGMVRSMQAVRTSYMTVSTCWPDYEKEAIAAANDFVDCMKYIPWYDFWDPESCKAIYDMQAIGAYTEWASCVALWNLK